jgi:hypothetical protein
VAADLERIGNELRDFPPLYRQPTIREMYAAINFLKESPYRGRAGRDEGTRVVPGTGCFLRFQLSSKSSKLFSITAPRTLSALPFQALPRPTAQSPPPCLLP